MFTRGSTGFPKGAVMTHANVLNFIAWGRTQYGITPEDVMTGVNPIYFDNSVFDLYVSIFNGATLEPFGTDHVRDPHALVKHVERLGCTIWFSVLARRVLRRGNFRSVADLREKILAYIAYHNRTRAKPYKWTYTGRPLNVRGWRTGCLGGSRIQPA